jgi:hypothetical protein
MRNRNPIVLVLKSVKTQTVRHDPNIVAIDIATEDGQLYRFGLMRSEFAQLAKQMAADAALLLGNNAGSA